MEEVPLHLVWKSRGEGSVCECGMTVRPRSPHLSLVEVFKAHLERRERVNQCRAVPIHSGPVLGPQEAEGHKNKQNHVFAFGGDRCTQVCVIHGRLCLLIGPKNATRKKERGMKF